MTVDRQAASLVFVDTNILVYAFDRSAGQKYTRASQIVADCWENRNGVISIQVLQELYINLTRKITHPLDMPTARNLVADLANWRLHCPEAGDLFKAIDLQIAHRLSFWDAMILQSAMRIGCMHLLSEDFNSGQKFGSLQVINPFISLDR